MVRIIISLVLLGHGLMHSLGTLYAFGGVENQWTTAPWAFGAGITLRSPMGRAFSLLFVLACLTLLIGTYGFWAGKDWYRAALTTGAALSVLAAGPWMSAIPVEQFFPIVSIDLLIMIALLFQWKIKLG